MNDLTPCKHGFGPQCILCAADRARRERIATAVFAALCPHGGNRHDLASTAVRNADALIEALDKPRSS